MRIDIGDNAMYAVCIRLKLKPLAGPVVLEARALLCDTEPATLRLVADTIATDNDYDIDYIGWECYFYSDDTGLLLAYVSDASRANEFREASVLKWH